MSQKELNLRQRGWIELLKDYDMVIDFYPGKVNVVADALSRKTISALRALDARLSLNGDGALLAELKLKTILLDRIKDLQSKDDKCLRRVEQVENERNKDFEVKLDGHLYYRGRLVIPDNVELKNDLLTEAHYNPLTMHLGENKIYMDLKSR
ncbi:uncharacterized protein LOC120115755 [Hibiscus syriacus]|uniref:uncharacterized protein LOC120115755 n=1 Tax=Hibiscus syriacus TaxID=106335 RepID=UPI0019243B16|nr:uncharacterized protein LOC120115755 [Hibiscus syriacus]